MYVKVRGKRVANRTPIETRQEYRKRMKKEVTEQYKHDRHVWSEWKRAEDENLKAKERDEENFKAKERAEAAAKSQTLREQDLCRSQYSTPARAMSPPRREPYARGYDTGYSHREQDRGRSQYWGPAREPHATGYGTGYSRPLHRQIDRYVPGSSSPLYRVEHARSDIGPYRPTLARSDLDRPSPEDNGPLNY